MTETNEKKKVFIIDDDPDVISLISGTLGQRGLEVFGFSNPDEAVAKTLEMKPSLVFASILLPGSNGLKVSKAIHSIEGMGKAPVIMLISYAGELDPRYTSTIGIVDVIVKPCNVEEILSKTAAVLGREAVAAVNPEALAAVGAGTEGGAASLDEEWFSYLDKEEEEGNIAPSVEEEPVTAEDIIEKAEEAAEILPEEEEQDFLPGKEGGTYEPEDKEEPYESQRPGGMSMKRIFLLAGIAVLIAGAGVGAFLFFQSGASKPVAPAAKAPVKAAARVAVKHEAPVGGEKALAEAGKAEKPAAPPATVEKPAEPKPGTAAPSAAKAAKSDSSGKKASPAAAKKTNYSIQVGAFQNKKNAVAFAGQLRRKGYDAFVSRDGGKAGHRVLIGKFDDPGRAAAQAKLLLKKEGLKSFIFHY